MRLTILLENELECDKIIVEDGVSIKDKIFQLLKKGMSIVAIAAALSLPLLQVQQVVAGNQEITQSVSIHQDKLVDFVAKVLYNEAGQQSIEGKQALASVIMNRAKQDPAQIKQVLLKPKQFSCLNQSKKLQPGVGKNWEQCKELAQSMVSGKFEPTVDATHYFNPTLCSPKWAENQPYLDIGSHRFLTLK
jgi:spore germination cell wall hydrolase CwlJ-like protein